MFRCCRLRRRVCRGLIAAVSAGGADLGAPSAQPQTSPPWWWTRRVARHCSQHGCQRACGHRTVSVADQASDQLNISDQAATSRTASALGLSRSSRSPAGDAHRRRTEDGAGAGGASAPGSNPAVLQVRFTPPKAQQGDLDGFLDLTLAAPRTLYRPSGWRSVSSLQVCSRLSIAGPPGADGGREPKFPHSSIACSVSGAAARALEAQQIQT